MDKTIADRRSGNLCGALRRYPKFGEKIAGIPNRVSKQSTAAAPLIRDFYGRLHQLAHRTPNQDIPANGFLAISAAVLAYASVSSFVCSPIEFTRDCMNSV
jgi:hypothetical protein